MMYMTKKRMNKLFRPSKKVEAKTIILFNSLDKIKKISKTPDDVIHNLIKWSFDKNGIFVNSKSVVSRQLLGKESGITLKNGDSVPHVSEAYSLYENSKTSVDLASQFNDYGDILTGTKNIIYALKTGKWFFKQNPLHSFGHYAKPIDKACAFSIVDNVKKTVGQILYLNDKGRAQRVNNFTKKHQGQLAK